MDGTVAQDDELFPPGEYIRDELDARGWTQEDLAEILGRPAKAVSQILTGQKTITARTAQELAAAFGTSAELWLNLQSAYDLARNIRVQDEVRHRSRLYEFAPVTHMIRRKWIAACETTDELERALLAFFEISSLDDMPEMSAAARKSTSYDETTSTQQAWLYRAKHLAKAIQVKRFSKARAEQRLDDLHSLTVSPQEIRKVPEILGDMGIRFVVVESLPRSKIDGAALWLDARSPVIAVSLRYDRIDWFWYTLSHELRHVLNGDGVSVDVDLLGDTARQDEIEERANREASEFLIPPEILDSFIARQRHRFSKNRIVQFANLHQIHPGIVVGQLQFRDEINYSHSREMLVAVRAIVMESAMLDGWGAITMSEQLEQQMAVAQLDTFIRDLLVARAEMVRPGDRAAPPEIGVMVSRDDVIDCFLKAHPEHERFRDACFAAYANRPHFNVHPDRWDAALET